MSNKLSKVTVEFERLVNELLDRFKEEAPWSSHLISNMATVLVDMIAGTATNNQFYLEFAAREAFLATARRQSSIFALSRMLGVKVVRRTSAITSVRLTNNTIEMFSVGSYSAFTVGGQDFYNRDAFILKAGESIEITLFKGFVRRKTITLEGADIEFPEILLGHSGFVVANHDLNVYTQDRETKEIQKWLPHDGSIFEVQGTDRKYFEATTGDGDISFTFGDGKFGKQLSTATDLVIQYIESDGSNGNGGLSGQQVQYTIDPRLSGTSTSPIAGGTAVKDKVFYKRFAPNMHRSNKRMSSLPDYISNIGMYPGVADVTVASQRDLAPNDPRMMNVVRICILPTNGTDWGGQNPLPAEDSPIWREFIKWAQDKVRPNTVLQPWNPEPIYIDINIMVAAKEGYSLQALKTEVTNSITELFRHKPGMLSRKLTLSDIEDAVKLVDVGGNLERRDGIDYISILSPKEHIPASTKFNIVTVRNLTINVRETERREFM